MSTLCDRLKYENEIIRKTSREQGRVQGILSAILATAKNMILNNENDETIIKYTNINPKDLEKLRKEVETSKK